MIFHNCHCVLNPSFGWASIWNMLQQKSSCWWFVKISQINCELVGARQMKHFRTNNCPYSSCQILEHPEIFETWKESRGYSICFFGIKSWTWDLLQNSHIIIWLAPSKPLSPNHHWWIYEGLRHPGRSNLKGSHAHTIHEAMLDERYIYPPWSHGWSLCDQCIGKYTVRLMDSMGWMVWNIMLTKCS